MIYVAGGPSQEGAIGDDFKRNCIYKILSHAELARIKSSAS